MSITPFSLGIHFASIISYTTSYIACHYLILLNLIPTVFFSIFAFFSTFHYKLIIQTSFIVSVWPNHLNLLLSHWSVDCIQFMFIPHPFFLTLTLLALPHTILVTYSHWISMYFYISPVISNYCSHITRCQLSPINSFIARTKLL